MCNFCKCNQNQYKGEFTPQEFRLICKSWAVMICLMDYAYVEWNYIICPMEPSVVGCNSNILSGFNSGSARCDT